MTDNLENPVLMNEVEALRSLCNRLSEMGNADDSQLCWQLRNLAGHVRDALDRSWVDRFDDNEARAEGRPNNGLR